MGQPSLPEESIFLQALEIKSAADRATFLDQACGENRELRGDVEALLRTHEQSGDLLDLPDTSSKTQDESATDEDGHDDLGFLAATDKPGSLGRLGHYDIQEVIGRGGMGIVLKAFDGQLHRVVAIKVMAAQLATNATARRRFAREAQAAAAVCHDHVVTIHSVDEASPLPYLVMQYVAGFSLQERLNRDGPLELHEILRIGMQTASGLAAAHAQGLIHRDIKPANILLENGVERVKITDFGLARAATDASLTQSGVVSGTPQYMSPEQARGTAVDQRTDLFSLGSVLYAMCTGRSPFRATGSMAVLKRVCDETPTPIRETNPEIPDWLVAIIAKLHAKDAAERFQSAAEVAELLGRHLAHVQHPSVAPLPPMATASVGRKPPDDAAESGCLRPPLAKRRRWAAAAAVLLLLMGGLSLTETTRVTNFRAVVIRIFSPEGALVVEEAPTGKPETQAFVVLSGKGLERKFDTLAEAVFGASAGDTIEVHGNGPFVCDPIEVPNYQALTIRAARGYRPVLRLSPDAVEASRTLLTTSAPLTIEGLEFQSPGAPKDPLLPSALLFSKDSPLRVANCRFVRTRSSLIVVAHRSPEFAIRNCEFTPTQGSRICVQWFEPPPTGKFSLEGCVLVSKGISKGITLQLDIFSGKIPQDLHLRCDHNTFVTEWPFLIFIGKRPEEKAGANAGGAPLVRLETTGNLFVHGRSVLNLLLSQLDNSQRAEWREGFLRRTVGWKGKANVYGRVPDLLEFWTVVDRVRQELPRPSKLTTLADWKQFWGSDEEDSLQDAPRFQGGDVLSKALNNPDAISAQDFRLAEDSPGKRAGKDGRDLGADVDLVGPGPAYERWKTTPAYQQWLKDTNQVRTPTPAPEPKAFVILSGKGAQVGKVVTLAEAVTDARDGDTIEIRGNGPFVTPALSVLDKALSIRAGEGFLPVIQLNEEGTKSGAPLFRAHGVRGSLSLEGLEIHGANYTRAGGGVWWLIRCEDAALHVTNCRFLRAVGDKGRLIFIAAWRCSLFQVRNCQFVNPPGDAPIAWRPHEGEKGIVKNCLFTCDYAVELPYSHPAHGSLSLENNTLATAWNLIIRLYKGPPLGTAADKVKLIHLEARENILGGDIIFWENPESIENKQSMSALQAESLLQRLILWKEAHNLHAIAPGKPFLTLKGPNAAYKKTTRPFTTLAEWQDFWGLEALDSLQGLPVFQGGDLLARATQNPQKLLPEDFRLAPGSPGKGAGPGGKDLGADVDLVGPGKAYERSKKTPEYQQWLKDTKQLGTESPDPERQAFVVLGGKGVAERKFATLAEAVVGAHAGDTIEVRGNGPFVCDPIVVPHYQALTIRAAPDFHPVLRLSPAGAEASRPLLLTSAPLTVEGLEFQRLGTPKPKLYRPNALLRSHNSPLHVANCRFVRTGPSGMVLAIGPPECEIRNCEFVGPQVHLGCVYWTDPPPAGKFSLVGCVFVSKAGVKLSIDSGKIPLGPRLRCAHNTFVTDGPFYFGMAKKLEEPKAGASPGAGPSIHLDTAGNLFASRRYVMTATAAPFTPTAPDSSLTAERGEAFLRQALGWKGKANLYPRVPDLLQLHDYDYQEIPRPRTLQTLADWKQFWGSEEEESLQDTPRFQGGDVLAKALNNPHAVSAQDFRLAEDSPGKRAGKDGRDLGADLDLVGPGAAYERWQQTPEYQQWLKDTGQVKK